MNLQELDQKIVLHSADDLANFHGLNKERVRNLFKKWWEGGRVAPSLLQFTPLDKACSLMNPERALEILETHDIDDIEYKESFVTGIVNSPYSPLFTIKELADVTGEFLTFHESNRDHIIETGFPTSLFSRSFWFDMHLSRLYYTKLPVDLPNTSGIPHVLDDRFENHLVMSLNENAKRAYNSIWIKEPLAINYESKGISDPNRRTHDWYFLYSINYEMRDGVLYDPKGREVEICPYSEAPIIDYLDEDIASRLQELREKVFDLRYEILNLLLNLAFRPASRTDTVDLGIDCISMIANFFTAEEAEFLREADQRLACLDRKGPKVSQYPMIISFYVNAGLNELLYVVMHFIQELTVGMMDELRNTLREITPYLTSYIEAFDKPWKSDLDEAIIRFKTLYKQRKNFCAGFMKKYNRAIQGRVPVKTSTPGKVAWPTKSEYDSKMSLISNFVAESIGEKGRPLALTISSDALVLKLIAGRLKPSDGDYILERNGREIFVEKSCVDAYLESSKTKKKKAVVPFKTPEEAVWEKLTIKFITEEAVVITYGDDKVAKDFVQMGFTDGRSRFEKPDTKWELFQALAKNSGCFDWSSYTNLNKKKKYSKKTFSELRQRLQKFFPDLPGDPFKPYRQEKAFETRFILRWKGE